MNWISGRSNRKASLQELHIAAYLALPKGLAQLSFPLLFFWLLLLLLLTIACDPFQKNKYYKTCFINWRRQKKSAKGYIFHSRLVKDKGYKQIPYQMNIFCVRCSFWQCWYNPVTPTVLLFKFGCVASPSHLLEMIAEVMSQEHYDGFLCFILKLNLFVNLCISIL